MANKIYSIQINGLQESVKAVDALSASLDELDKKIKALEGKAVKIGSTGGDSKSSSTGALSEEEKIQKQIEQIEEKRLTNAKEIYREYIKAKDALKEVEKNQKSIASAERLDTKTYANTIAGMKQELADIKSAMQNVDLGDTDQLDKMTQRANELNGALKKIEESYGQFGRNVGNYKSAADGFKGLKIEVAGVNQEFDSAKQAAKALGNELQTLQVKKDKGIMLSDEELKRFEELPGIVAQLKSSIQDAGKPMDNLMDTMQSLTSIAQVTKGFSAFFGIDDTEIQRSIQQLVGLQNAMKGLQEIQKQIQTREGIGKWVAPFNAGIDKATSKLLVFNRTLFGTGKAAKVAATGINLFSKALKLAFTGGILIAVDLLIEKILDLVESFKKADEAAEKEKEIQKEVGKAYATASANLVKYTTIVQNFNGTKKQEEKLVKQLNSELGNSLGTYKSLSEWQDVLTKKGAAYIQMLVLQAKAQAAFNKLVDAQTKESEARDKATDEYMGIIEQVQNFLWSGWGTKSANKARVAAIQAARAYTDEAEEEFVDAQKKVEDFMEKNGIGDYAPQIEKNGQKSADAAKKAQEDIRKKQIDAMKDGLNKTLMQLDEEERQTLNKLRENGNKTNQLVKQTQEAYTQLRINAISEYLNKLTKTVEDSQKKIAGIRFSIDTKDIELDINKIEEKIKKLTDDVVPINNTLTTKFEFDSASNGLNPDLLKFATDYDYQRGKADTEAGLKEYFKWLEGIVSLFSKDVQEKLKTQNILTGEMELDYNAAEKYIEEHYKKELNIVRSYGYQEKASLSSSFEFRLNALRSYDAEYISEINKALEEEMKLKQEAAKKDEKNQFEALDESYKTERNALVMRKAEIDDSLKAISKLNINENEKLKEKFKKSHAEEIKNLEETNAFKIETYGDYYKSLQMSLEKQQKKTNEQLEEIEIQHGEKMAQINEECQQKLTEIERQTTEKRQQNQQRYYDKQLSNYRDSLSKINSESAKQPVTDKAGWNIVDIGAAYKTYNEILDATKTTFENIKKDKEKLNEDFKKGLIKPENYNATLNQLNDLENETKQTAQTVVNDLNNLLSNFQQSINQYIQAGLQAVQDVMSAIADYQDYQFDKEQEELDKLNDMIQEKLDKQEDIISKHKDRVDSIEDELANSRGDRRQHLIDQLNAEMEAERAAYKEKQKLEKQEEEAKKKQDDIDKQRREAEYKRNIMSIIVSTAMATANGLATQPFVPVGIAMGALATTLGMVQLALARAQKPYAKGGQLEGGVAQGPRHRDGGIPVLGGRASIEGGEFITNRLSTANNIDLLEFINSKKKKVDVSDLIDFYSSGNIKKNISGIRTKFEDGGFVPTLPNSIDVFDNRLIQSFEAYSNRPVVVSVVDINNKQADVKRVQTLAGL